MRIGIDAAIFQGNAKKTGIPISVETVLRQWSAHHTENEYYLFARKEISLDIDWKENWHIVSTPYRLDALLSPRCVPVSKCFEILYRFLGLKNQINQYGLDVFWGPGFLLRAGLTNGKNVVSVYDLAMYHFKHISEKKNEIIQKLELPRSVRKADKIITVSHSTAEDVHSIFKVKKSKIFISYQGGLSRKIPEDIQEFDSEMNPALYISGRFILFISTIEPRKNVLTLIKGFEKYLDTYHEDDLYLVLAGGRGWQCEPIYEAIQNSRYHDRIIVPGYISNEEKTYLLDHASVFAYPSLYEGFGIPILEAFDRNLPVITSNVSSMPEVGGDAAFYINDPYNADELAAQLRKTLTLSEAEKAEVLNRMRRQLAKFSWEKNAEEIMKMFQCICKGQTESKRKLR